MINEDKRIQGNGFLMTGKYDGLQGIINIKIRYDKTSRANLIRQADVENCIMKAVGGGYRVVRLRISRGFNIIFIQSYDASQQATQKIMINIKNNLEKLIANIEKKKFNVIEWR